MVVDLPLSPLAVLAFLGACLCIVAGAVVFIFAKVRQKAVLARRVLIGLGSGMGLYLVLMLGASALSKEYVLGRNVEKHFCELDCHVAYSVSDVRQAKVLGEGADTKPANGTYYIVTIKTRFDETTIGPKRGNGILYPNPRKVLVVDEQGREFLPLAADAAQLLEKPLHPSEHYESQLVFDLPTDARGLKLFIKNDDWPNNFLIGHENSPFHKKAYFNLS